MLRFGVAVMAIIYRRREGKLEVLLQQSESLIPKHKWQGKLAKFPGGRMEETDADYLSACVREVKEEVHLYLKEGVEPVPVYDYIIGTERKIFFPMNIDELEGQIRTEVKDDNSSRLFPPYWIELTEDVVQKVIYRTHRSAAMRFLREYNKK